MVPGVGVGAALVLARAVEQAGLDYTDGLPRHVVARVGHEGQQEDAGAVPGGARGVQLSAVDSHGSGHVLRASHMCATIYVI